MRRLPEGGLVDRSAPITVTWAGRELEAFAGDTLASALLANGVAVAARSAVHARPRGIYSAGMEEPNAFVQVEAPWSEPMVAATCVEVVEGLAARPLAGFGRLTGDDTARHDKRHAHCELLVVGAAEAGIEAARAAAARGNRVIVADADFLPIPPVEGDTRLLPRTVAIGSYDDNMVLLVERVAPERRRIWQVRAAEVVLATGAYERPIVFPGNDLPGVMLAGAALAYRHRFGVAPERPLVFTNNDSGMAVARTLGAPLVDLRAGEAVVGTEGGEALEAVLVAPLESPGEVRRIECDLLAVSGGHDPALDLHRHRRGAVRWDEPRACFVPDGAVRGQRIVGRAAGDSLQLVTPCWAVPGADERAYVDLHRDVTVADVRRAVGAGLASIEHVKRYTLIGTGADQGRTAKVNGAGLAASLLGREVGRVGTSTSRPPVLPVGFAVLAGRGRGLRFDPVRTTPIHTWHVAHGALFEDVGQWKRPWYFPQAGESMDAAVLRECRAAREGVAMMDASTLGKIDVQGPDAGEFLDRLYTNTMSTVQVGRARYGLMCKADGMVFDDGVAMRLAEDRYLCTTTTGGAAGVLDWMEEWLQTEWPELAVRLTSVTEQWATVAVVGPHSRDLLQPLTGLHLANESLPFLSHTDAQVAGIEARVARISFSGELAFEVSVPGTSGLALWEALWAAGGALGVTAYGTESMHVLRAEKGYPIIGQDTDGTVTPFDLGMDWIVKKARPFVGSRSLRRPDTARDDRKQLVGLMPEARLPEGAQLVDGSGQTAMVGHVTSSYVSATLGVPFALAMVERGRERIGQTLVAPLPQLEVAARVVDPVFYDPEGARRDG